MYKKNKYAWLANLQYQLSHMCYEPISEKQRVLIIHSSETSYKTRSYLLHCLDCNADLGFIRLRFLFVLTTDDIYFPMGVILGNVLL